MALGDGRTYAAFAGAVVIGGANFVAVSFSNMELAPLYGAAVRFAMGSALFFAIARLWRVPLARGRAAAGAAVYGLLAYGAAYAMLYVALLGLSAGTVSVIVAAVPLLTLAFAVLVRQERWTLRSLTGGVLVVVGIAILSVGELEAGLARPYLAAAILGAVAISLSSVLAKALPDVHPVNMNAFGMAAGTGLLIVGSLALREPWVVPRTLDTWLAVGWLVALGSVGLFQLFFYVIRRWTASATVYAVAGMPVVAVALGAVLLAQPVTWEVVVGGAIVMLAVWMGAAPRAGPARSPTLESAVPAAPGYAAGDPDG